MHTAQIAQYALLLRRGVRRLSDCQRDVVANPKTVEAVMARYRVELVQTVVETAIVYLEANNSDEGERLALRQAVTGSGIAWRFKDTLDGIEFLSVQPIITERWHDENKA